MQSDLERIKEMVRGLPVEELDELEAAISEERKAKLFQNGNKEFVDSEIQRFRKSQKWLDENREKYLDQWVCLDGDKLIAHGVDALEVDRKAKEAGIESPFIEHIVEEEHPFGGW